MQCIIIVLNDVTSKSREQRLITKEHIATHTNLILLFKPALFSSTFYAEILTVALGQSSFIRFATFFFYKVCNLHGTPTFKTEELRLVSNVQLVKRLLPCNKRQIQHYLALLWKQHTTRFVTKGPPINSIDSKCCTEKLKGSRTCLIGYSDFISRE